MKIRPMRIVLWLGLALAAFGVYVAFQPKPVEADFATTVRGPLVVTLDDEGETRVRDRYVTSAPVAGQVLRIELEPGDEVRAGQTVLARFRPAAPTFLDSRTIAEARAQVETAVASKENARVSLDKAVVEHSHAKSELARYERLFADGLVAERRIESARLNEQSAAEAIRAAEAEIEVAGSEIERAQTLLIQTTSVMPSDSTVIPLTSPISGVVLQRLRESAAVVPAGDPLLEIADPSKLEIVSDMLSSDAVRIKPGYRVLIEQWGGDVVLEGTVRLVEPYGFTKISALGVEEQRVNVIVDFKDVREAWEALGDGYRVEVRVVIWEEESVVKVPSGSLFRNGDGWAVYVVDELSFARLRAVEVGQRNAEEAQILSGLAVGESVVAFPSDEVSDGTELARRQL